MSIKKQGGAPTCDPEDVAVKSFFLGPASENAEWLAQAVQGILQNWFRWRQNVEDSGELISPRDRELFEFKDQQQKTLRLIQEICSRFENEIPKFSPRYLGHMFSEISMPALLGHMITLLHNPNNIAPDASTVGLEIEKDAIFHLSQMIGYDHGVGHFTSGGTVANFEFLVRARERMALWLSSQLARGQQKNLTRASSCGWEAYDQAMSQLDSSAVKAFDILDRPAQAREEILKFTGATSAEPLLFVSSSKHYSWPKAMHFMGIGASNIQYIPLDRSGRAESESLKEMIQQALRVGRPILGCVGIAGTTELGSIDPIDEMQEVLDDVRRNEGLHIWLHVDGAYGGFFKALTNFDPHHLSLTKSSQRALDALSRADSVTLDPHKLGYVPYSSGTFLCQHSRNYYVRSFSGPYIDSSKLNVGNFTLEGSRSAAGAVATYASLRSFADHHGYARILSRSLAAKRTLMDKLAGLGLRVFFPEGLDTNIICFTILDKKIDDLKSLNRHTLALYQRVKDAKTYWISKTTLDAEAYHKLIVDFCRQYGISHSQEGSLVLLRLTLMNPFLTSKESKIDHIDSFCKLIRKEHWELITNGELD